MSSDKGSCAQCPWRTENQGKKHPLQWYTKANLTRLWSKLRRGESMSCHATDPNVELPEGAKPVPENTKTRECAGALILVQREMLRFQDDPKGYFKTTKGGMTRIGLIRLAERSIFSGTPLGEEKLPLPNLNELAVQHPKLKEWTPR